MQNARPLVPTGPATTEKTLLSTAVYRASIVIFNPCGENGISKHSGTVFIQYRLSLENQGLLRSLNGLKVGDEERHNLPAQARGAVYAGAVRTKGVQALCFNAKTEAVITFDTDDIHREDRLVIRNAIKTYLGEGAASRFSQFGTWEYDGLWTVCPQGIIKPTTRLVPVNWGYFVGSRFVQRDEI
ncbi:MAG TPA: hypothetical protein VGE62_03310 [Candidatus Paceibacterota bacterium]